MISSILLIAWNVIAPLFLMLGLGWGVQKWLGLDVRSLTRLNFWVFVPSFLFVQIVGSKLSPREVGLVSLHFCLVFATMGLLTWQAARLVGANDRLRRSMTSAVIFYNSGNYGVPAAQLAFSEHAVFAVGVQSIIIMFQNTANFTVGLALQAGGREGSSWKSTARAILSLPMVYTLAAGWTWRWVSGATGWPLPSPLDSSLQFLAQAMAPFALVTLGAQMGTLKSHKIDRNLLLALWLRLLVAPLLSWGVVWMLGIQGALAASLVVSASFPTAINSALLALEFDNEPDFAASTVFYSTLLSALTVSLVIYAARAVYG